MLFLRLILLAFLTNIGLTVSAQTNPVDSLPLNSSAVDSPAINTAGIDSPLTHPATGDSVTVDYSNPKEYTLAGITVTGTQYLDKDILIALSGLKVGDKIDIPGSQISKAIQNLWKQDLFADVKIFAERFEGSNIYINIKLEERPRLSGFTFRGIKKSEQDDLRDKIKLNKGKVLTDNVKVNTINTIKGFYNDKGFLHSKVTVEAVPDSSQQNSMLFVIFIDKGNRVKIDNIDFTGNKAVSTGKLHRLMKKTKENPWYSIFTVSKYKAKEYETDKEKILTYYASKGYRDAHIVSDTVYENPSTGNLKIEINLFEGNKYYFHNITWSGNTKYAASRLDSVLRVHKGDVYDESYLQKRLNGDPNGSDVSSLYQDDGYLFFQVNPVEVGVTGDSIDLEMRIYEGPQATIDNVTIEGNTKTHEHVVRRVIRTVPGEKFSRADVIRTQREIATLGFFDPEKIGINPLPHPESGTVDMVYSVQEKPSDQVELSAGFSPGYGVIGSIGIRFTNFSIGSIFKPDAWRPLPSGDGQVFSIRAQSTGKTSQSLSVSFTEPWLGGKKPNSFNVGIFGERYTNGYSREDIRYGQIVAIGGSLGLGKQLHWPDDYFTLVSTLTAQNYNLKNYTQFDFAFNTGNAHEIYLKETFGRNSEGPDFTFPKWGSNFNISLAVTPPYSLFSNKNYSTVNVEEKYRWVEFHKWNFQAEWYNNPFGKFVLRAQAKGGYLGYYNSQIGLTSFERFKIGGNGIPENTFTGIDVIGQRGYDNAYISNAAIYNKYTLELRYPFSTNPSAFIYGTLWLEAGNGWYNFRSYDPFNLRRAAGFGVRVFLPIFGIVGFDYGWGLDPGPGNPIKGAFNIVLGFEPE